MSNPLNLKPAGFCRKYGHLWAMSTSNGVQYCERCHAVKQAGKVYDEKRVKTSRNRPEVIQEGLFL